MTISFQHQQEHGRTIVKPSNNKGSRCRKMQRRCRSLSSWSVTGCLLLLLLLLGNHHHQCGVKAAEDETVAAASQDEQQQQHNKEERQQGFEIPSEDMTEHQLQQQRVREELKELDDIMDNEGEKETEQLQQQLQQQHEVPPPPAAQSESDQQQHQEQQQDSPNENKDSPKEETSALPSPPPPPPPILALDEYGITTLDNYRSFAPALKQQHNRSKSHGLLLVLLYSTSDACPTNQEVSWVTKLQGAVDVVRTVKVLAVDDDDHNDSNEVIQFGKLDTSKWEGSAEWLTSVGLETTPMLVFVVARNFQDANNNNNGLQQQQQQHQEAKVKDEGGHVFLLDYIGPLTTSEDIGMTVLQYYYQLFQTTTTPRAALRASSNNNLQEQQRLLLKPFPNLRNDFGAHIVPKAFDSLVSLDAFWKAHRNAWQQIAASARIGGSGIHPKYAEEDRQYAQWLLLHDNSNNNNNNAQNAESNVITLLVQCQAASLQLIDQESGLPESSTSTKKSLHGWYETFAEMAWILSSRRDVWFLALEGGDEGCLASGAMIQPGQVSVFHFPLAGAWPGATLTSEDRIHSMSPFLAEQTLQQEQQQDDSADIHKKEVLRRFLIEKSTPAVLWYDRIATAPIAFADAYQVHCILMINLLPPFHKMKSGELDRYDERIQRLIQDFHTACARMKRDRGQSICLIVPSTETRFLTSFDVDLWTPLDARASNTATSSTEDTDAQSSQSNDDVLPKFPILLITDRRPQLNRYRDGITTTTHGVRRYFLRTPDTLHEHAVSQFVDDFWNQQLVPDLRSSTASSDTAGNDDDNVNAYGITSLTGLEFQQRFQTMATSTEHALVLFTAPSCGHCKRFHNVYNEASRLIQELKWDQHMALYKVDISQNEVHKMSLPWLPDVYYFPPIETEDEMALPIAPIRYDIVDDMGDGVGRVSDPMDIIDWWLDVMVGEGDWIDPDILLDILNEAQDAPADIQPEPAVE